MTPLTEPVRTASTRAGLLSCVEAVALLAVAAWFAGVVALIIVSR